MGQEGLKHLSRLELLDILVSLRAENEALSARVDELATQNKDLIQKLADKQIAIDNAGSIAEAALSISGMFDACEKACALYMTNLGMPPEQIEKTLTVLRVQAKNNQRGGGSLK